MPFNIENLPLVSDPYSHDRMSFLKPKNALDLAAVMQLYLIEMGPREARENWQRAQLRNLLTFIWERSAFWRRRLGPGKIDKIKLSALPVFTRAELNEQYAAEKCLIGPADRLQIFEGQTSGSSGTPTRFFQTAMNSEFATIATVLNELSYPFPASYNETNIRFQPESDVAIRSQKTRLNQGAFNGFLREKVQKTITFNTGSVDALVTELGKDRVGCLTTYPWTLDLILRKVSLKKLKGFGCDTVVLLGGEVEQELIASFREAGVNLRSTYSCREVGSIGVSCPDNPGFYHVRGTNVLVEVDPGPHVSGNPDAGRVLLTGLHSYATPFIRYDVGDIATYHKRCPCGFDGPTLEKIHGRTKSFIKTADGALRLFMPILAYYSWLGAFREYRFIQTDLRKMQVFIGGRAELTADERERFATMIRTAAGAEMETEIVCCEEINWGMDAKRLVFRCDV